MKLRSVKEAVHKKPPSDGSTDKCLEQGNPLGIKAWLAGGGGREKRSDHQEAIMSLKTELSLELRQLTPRSPCYLLHHLVGDSSVT